MILPAAATAGPSVRRSLKLKMLEKSSDSESDLSEYEMEESDESDDEVEMEDDDLAKARSTMLKTQHLLHPPTKESDLANKWFKGEVNV